MATTTDLTVAETILEQLGGRRFVGMVGAKDILGGADSLQFKIGAGARNGCNCVRIVLDSSDTYTVTFYRLPRLRRRAPWSLRGADRPRHELVRKDLAMTTPIPANDALVAESRHQHGRDVRDVAKLVRADIAAAVASGALPAGLEASVRISRYSMGQSLDVNVTTVPAGFVIHSVGRIRWELEHPYDVLPEHLTFRHSSEARRVLGVLEQLVAAYNRERIDSASDYFNVSFHAHVGFAGALEQACREEIEADVRGARVG